jgi:hypothetical protein
MKNKTDIANATMSDDEIQLLKNKLDQPQRARKKA